MFADYRAYIDCEHKVASAYSDPDRWAIHSILNVARSGEFYSDRAIRRYCENIWHVSPIQVDTRLPEDNR